MTGRRIAVIGASLAGLRTAEALRSGGFDGGLTLIGDEAHLPYDRPPLSKQVLTGEMPAEQVYHRDAQGMADLGIDLIVGDGAAGLDVDAGTIRLASGAQVPFDEAVVATGARARRPFANAPANVLALRTLDDALTLREVLRRAGELVVVGGGFIGFEVASAARALGVEVTIVEAAPRPYVRSVCPDAARVLAQLARDHGVRVLCGRSVAGFTGAGLAEGVRLDDGSVLTCDLVLVGVGAVPNVEWLAGSGLTVSPAGVACDEGGRAHPAVWAAGDVAAWAGADGRHRRHEHWTSAGEQAHVVANNILRGEQGEQSRIASAPYVWSDQFGKRISIVGRPADHDSVRVLSTDPDRLAALYARDGILTGACLVDQMSLVLRCRKWVAQGARVQDLSAWADAA